MLEFGGLWKHQNNPACTKSVRVFIMLKLDTIRKKKKKKKKKTRRRGRRGRRGGRGGRRGGIGGRRRSQGIAETTDSATCPPVETL